MICYTLPEIWCVTDYFSFWAIFCPFTPITAQKSKLKKNEKIPGDIIILHMCTKNYDQMLYSC